ncbi:1619_t:CDS:2, partial [Entrophospora sp. SA101]
MRNALVGVWNTINEYFKVFELLASEKGSNQNYEDNKKTDNGGSDYYTDEESSDLEFERTKEKIKVVGYSFGLKPEDLISNGIINEIELERKFPIFYNNLIKVGLVKKTKIIKYVEMSEDTCAFINNFFKYNKVEVPLSVGLEQSFYHELLGMMLKMKRIWTTNNAYQSKQNINERTYMHNLVDGLVNFTLFELGLEGRFDGSKSQATQHRNGKDNETSNGPFVENNQKHINEDFNHLSIFSKDAVNHNISFLRKFENYTDELEPLVD